jgi:DDE superfamily endonuclease
MDEKGFIIGFSNVVKRIMLLEAYKSGRIRHTQTDGNREFISLVAGICTDGTSLPPALVYKGESYDLQSSWLDELGDDKAYFAASSNGWSCDNLGLQWLEKVFDKHTRAKAGRSRRLLIVDGHSSHVNMQFLDTADRLRILVHRLPAHTTHRLQPLDISVFSALSIAYSKQLNALQHKSLGLVSMSKRLFYPLFRDAFEEAFEKSRIERAFEKAGIWPFNPSAIINILEKPSLEELGQSEKPKTPMTSRAIRRIHREYKANHSVSKLKLILHGHEKLAAQHSINEHIIDGL